MTLANGETLAADLVVVGIGVRPAIALAEQAGLAVDRGVSGRRLPRDERRRASSPPATSRAGPTAHRRADIRVEHWVVAERQGQAAARNMLGRRERFDAVPFFWTEQYDFSLAYVGHAERWDEAEIDGASRRATARHLLARRQEAGRRRRPPRSRRPAREIEFERALAAAA